MTSAPVHPSQPVSEADIEALLAPWPGPCGGLPPLDRATPAAIEAAFHRALDLKRQELHAIARDPAAPGFANTLEALEDCGRALGRVQCLLGVHSSSMSLGEMPAVAQRLAALAAGLEDEIAHDRALFARIDAIWSTREDAGLDALQQRLVQVGRERMLRRGAGLNAADQARLQAINGRLAALSSRYNQNLIAEQAGLAVFIDADVDLAGLSEAQRLTLAAAATARGRQGAWAVDCTRPAVWQFLMHSTRRELREKVWRMWTDRGDHEGPHDNKPVANEMLALRGEKARLLGFASYAHLALADRMAGTPEAALEVLKRTWGEVFATTRRQIADFQALADEEGQGVALAPWDRLHYAEKLRRARFGLDADAIKPYLPLEAMLQAMFWCAGRLYGLIFEHLPDAPVVHPSCRVYAVSRVEQGGREPVGVLYFDLFNRPGKMHGSYQSQYRCAESFRGRVLPIASINSTFPSPDTSDASGTSHPVLLPWEYANVFFHEFGHALHMLCNRAPYPSLGSLGVAWDFVELPALLNERWLLSREVLERFARHHQTGEPLPAALLDGIERAARYDRIFSLNLDYLAPAIVDLRLHLLADGVRVVDAAQVEQQVVAEVGLPDAWDQIMRVTHNFHCFAGAYAAGLYSYLWADVMAADAAEAYTESPGGLFDIATATRWHDTVLSVGSTMPADQAWRHFRGRDPDPQALLRRFGLAAAP